MSYLDQAYELGDKLDSMVELPPLRETELALLQEIVQRYIYLTNFLVRLDEISPGTAALLELAQPRARVED